ncbi:MAG TPA: hypothetical protein VNR11_07285 [Xanthobacteraceae bacterium]|nr:hypothetical protein [Xanthobacteraceae bacterium]
MFAKTTLVLAAALVAGSTLAARADATIHDSNSGLESRYYYGPLADLERQGLPISDSARAYVRAHGAAAAVRQGNVYLLEDRGFGSVNTSEDKQRPW